MFRSRTWIYVWTYLGLMLLLALNVASILIEPSDLRTAANVAVAAAMAVLIILFFMHTHTGGSLVRLIAAVGFFWLLIMLGLSMSDYLTRPADLSVGHFTEPRGPSP